MAIIQRISAWARRLRRDVHALYLAARDPRVSWHAKLVAVAVAAYALSPIDLIPDFVPVLGLLDDLVIVPLGLMLAVRLIPRAIMEECRAKADAAAEKPVSRAGAVAIVLLWLALAAGAGFLAYRYLAAPK